MKFLEALKNAYRQACEIDVLAFKPGNVSIFSEGHDMTVEDFRISSVASAEAITNPAFSLGEKIYYAVEATRDAVACNTNLGIILLCAPLLEAAIQRAEHSSLRESLSDVLDGAGIDDAEWVFRAIVLAAPGGLGRSAREDVNQSAGVTLVEAMALAAERDRVAFQYTNRFKDIFEFAVLSYNRAFVLSGDSGWAASAVFCEMLARYPDSHVERKYGRQYSEWIAEEMTKLCEVFKPTIEPERLLPELYRLDKAFKLKKINPGTTADITVAAVLVVLLEQMFGNT